MIDERHAQDGERVPATLVGLLRAEHRGTLPFVLRRVLALPPGALLLTVWLTSYRSRASNRKPVGRERRRHRWQTAIPRPPRRGILAAAVREFSAKGISGARVDAIAARAKVNKRMLYYYFESKEGLFREILRRRLAEGVGALRASRGRRSRPARRAHRAAARRDAVHAPHSCGRRSRPTPTTR